MASAIDATKPEHGTPTTQSVRDNFATAKSEIEALQSGKAASAHAHALADLTGGIANPGQVPTWTGLAWEPATPVGTGDMLKSTYDTTGNGKVDVAESAEAVAWLNVSGKPATFPPDAHNHDGVYELADLTILKDADIGGTVQGYAASASQVEMEAGTEAGLRAMSPLRVKQAITALGGASLPVVDTTALAKGSVDATKQVRLEVDGLTTGTTRVLTVPDADITLAGTNIAQTFTAPQTATAVALTDGATVTWAVNTDQSVTLSLTGAGHTLTTSGTPPEGAVYMLTVTPTGAYSLGWTAATLVGNLATLTQTATSGKTDCFIFRSDGTKLNRICFSADIGG